MEISQLNGLIETLKDSVGSASPFKTRWREIWQDIKKISAAFKDTRFPTKEERQEKWEHFQSLVNKVKEIQADEQNKWEEKARSSSRHKSKILSCAYSATPSGPFGDLIINIISLPVLPVKAALDAILPGPELDEKHHELKACSAKLKEGWNLMSEYKDEMLGRDKKEAFSALREAQDKLNSAWEQWKEGKTKAREAKDAYFKAKREAFHDRVRERIETHKERLERLYEVLSKAERHLDSLREQRSSAWSDSFRDRVEGWINEEEDRISSIKEKINRIEGWLDEDRRKL